MTIAYDMLIDSVVHSFHGYMNIYEMDEHWVNQSKGSSNSISCSVQFSSVMSNSLHLHGLQHARLPCPSPTPRVYSNSCPSSRWCHPTISSCQPLLLLPSISASIRVFSNESVCIRWPKYWSFSFSISPSNEHPGLISFRMDWLDLLAVQGTLKILFHEIWFCKLILTCVSCFLYPKYPK